MTSFAQRQRDKRALAELTREIDGLNWQWTHNPDRRDAIDRRINELVNERWVIAKRLAEGM